jgi:iron(III) transport system substrate-binding protein
MTIRHWDRRDLLKGVAGAGGAALLPGAARAQGAMVDAARREGRLTIYTDLAVEVIQAIIASFRQQYAGIEVDFVRGDTGPMTQRFETESAAGRHQADVITNTDRQARQLAARGFTQPHTSAHIEKYPRELRAPNDAWSPYSSVQFGIAWNTDRVRDADAPTSWQDLLAPRWRNQLGMQDPLQGGGAGIWVVTMYEVMGEERWTDYMRRLGQQRLRYGRYLEVRDMAAAGEIAVQVVAYPSFTQPLMDRGAPLKWRLFDPVIYTALTINLSRNARSPNAGRLFIDFITSEAGQRLLADRAQIPAMPAMLPPAFAPIAQVTLVPQAIDLEQQRFDFFQQKMREFFVR